MLHLVIIAWLYVTFAMALTSPSAWSGIALFVGVGLAPVVLVVWLAVRRHRAARAREGSAGVSSESLQQRKREP